VDSAKVPDRSRRITPAEHLQAAMIAKEQRTQKRRADLARAKEWAEERRKRMIPHYHPAYEYVTRRLAEDRDEGYKISEPWCFEARLKIHLTRWHQLTQSKTDNVVYYIQVGKYIKIGTTKDVDKRLQQYPPDSELLAIEPGSFTIEDMRHKQFAKYLAARNEWFSPGPKLMQHIAGLQRMAAQELRDAQNTERLDNSA
jgi:hypothetical protein